MTHPIKKEDTKMEADTKPNQKKDDTKTEEKKACSIESILEI